MLCIHDITELVFKTLSLDSDESRRAAEFSRFADSAYHCWDIFKPYGVPQPGFGEFFDYLPLPSMSCLCRGLCQKTLLV